MTADGVATRPRPRQAVILAAERGEQLGALTDTRPLAMVEVHGRPLLEYIVELLRDEGFADVLMLLGYLPDVVRDHFQDGHSLGIRISYSVASGPEVRVADLLAVRHLVQEHFLLLHADNYWPMRIDPMWRQYLSAGGSGLLTVYANKDGYSRDNVRVSPDGFIELMDYSGTHADLKGVEISYAILHREVLDQVPQRDARLEEGLYQALVQRRQLVAHMTDHRFYGVGSLDRLPLTNIFLARKPAVILDRDGVLNRRSAPGEYVRSVAEFEWLPGALEALRAFRTAGFTVIVASNQAGLARGQVSVEALEAIHSTMRAQALAAGGGIDAIYHCPHDWYAGCECRKPRPGLLFQAQRDFSLDLTRTPVLGDEDIDMRAAEAAGALGFLVTAERPLLFHAHQIIEGARHA